ncbi:carbohydrate sulfotransferase 15-like isoform X1 [Haliotis cracherodii]|uniref:carbohydrate sulfotransferase 15-like isoform X1 n=2 Tax=Haliotis cracherodii TaxID=6455 RepID=UPI0039ECC667
MLFGASMSSLTMKRHYANTTLVYQRGVKLFVSSTPSMLRLRIKKLVMAIMAALFVLVVLRASIGSSGSGHTYVPNSEPAGFQDLAGSHTVLEPLIIHKNMEPVPPEEEARQTEKKPEKKTEVEKKMAKVDPAAPDDVMSMAQPNLLSNFKNPCWRETNGTITRVRCLPYFHLIGVDKSGTTDLWYRLSQHPDLVKPNAVLGKETHWWSWRRFGFDIWVNNARIQHFNEYLSAFDKPALQINSTTQASHGISDYHQLVTGEGSPTVFWDMTGWNRIPQNNDKTVDTALLTPHCIHHLTPKAKFLIIFRNPTDRLYSDYLFLQLYRAHKKPLTAQSFHTDVQESLLMLKQCQDHHTLKECLFNKTLHMNIPVRIPVSFYAVYLKEWFKVFPRENFLILRNEDYSKDIRGHIEKVYNFLEFSKLPDQELNRIANMSRAYTRNKQHQAAGEMLGETRELLNNFHNNLNIDLAQLLQDDRFKWTDPVSK